MIDVALARSLRDAGLRWRPRTGDRFRIDGPEFGFDDGDVEADGGWATGGADDDGRESDGTDVFTISEMTIEAHEYPTGTELGFNGTTEWALDSVSTDDSLWLPREDQLRELLGRAFVSLTRGAELEPGFTVSIRLDGEPRDFTDVDAENAYGQALLAYIDQSLRIGDIDG